MTNILKYTANYSYTNHNFVIQNLNNSKQIDNDMFATFCVLKNILQRGKPSLLSAFLQEKIGTIHKNSDFFGAYPLISKEFQCWQRTIKGSTNKCYNPAQDFLENIIPEYLGKYKCIQNLIIPEVQINTITQEYNEDFVDQQVDFYLPQAFLIIEIDGSQHNEKQQKQIDDKRDKYLKQKGYTVVRFETNELNSKNATFLRKIELIKNYLDKLNKRQEELKESNSTLISLNDYAKAYENGINLTHPYYKATAIIRFQILLLELLCVGKLDFNKSWNLEIVYHDIEDDFIKLAIDDLFNWLSALFSLRQIPFNFNNGKNQVNITKKQSIANFSNNKNTIFIDFSLLKRYTDENEKYRNVIFVRTDYFDKYLILVRKTNPLEDIDYFEMSTTKAIKYNINIASKEQYNTLLTLTWDIFLQAKDTLSRKTVTFREGQFEIIANALNRNDTIGLLPTGSGKSICYQLACLLQPTINFVVCPIISLMIDQVENLQNAFIYHIASIASNIDANEKSRIQYNFSKGKYFFIFISPERLQNISFRNYLSKLNDKYKMGYIVIDEAHCLSEWGHDFRISYLNLVDTIKNLCSDYKFIALTATASQNVLKDLQIELNIQEEKNIKTPLKYSRDELLFSVIENTADKYSTLVDIFNELNEDEFYINNKAGLVFTPYAGGITGTEIISSKLKRDLEQEIGCYNGKLPDFEKRKAQEDFKKNKVNILVVTKAFGMGIDKGNIAYTIHYGIPTSMESLYQEAGRAGRDKELFTNKKALCMVLLSREILKEEQYNVLWSPKSSYEDICEIYKDLNGDLKTQLYFFVAGNKPIDEDCKKINEFYINIKTMIDKNSTEFKPKCSRNDAEKYLYKLKQLGIISDWTIDFRSDTFNLSINKKNIDNIPNIKTKLQSYINKYDTEFDFNKIKTNSDYKYYRDILMENISDFEKYTKILLQWNFNTFVYTRRQSLKNIYENCINFIDKDEMNPDKFKSNIENYFKFSGRAQTLKAIADEPLSYRKWFEVFYVFDEDLSDITNTIITEKDAQELLGNLSRLLESYMQNTGLDFVSGLVRLFLDDYNNTDGRIRFESALKKVKQLDQDEQNEIMFNLFKITKTLPLKNRNELSKSLTDIYSNDKEFLYKIYDNLEDDNSLLLASEGFLKRIKSIRNRIEVK